MARLVGWTGRMRASADVRALLDFGLGWDPSPEERERDGGARDLRSRQGAGR